ncbi:MAG: thioredoxin [Clostridiales bacterium]|nr:thioredoxin [Clostridiales bacterium]
MASDKIVLLTDESYENEAVKSDTPVLIDFYADWCGPCRMVAPVLDSLAEKYDGKVKICKVNVDEQRKLAIAHKVMSIPTLIFMNNGEVVERVTGALPQASIEEKLTAML